MRVLNVLASLHVGGTEKYVTRIAPILRRSFGIDVELCLLNRAGPLVRVAEANGIPVFGTDARRRALRSVAYAAVGTMREVATLISTRKYDIVHSYLFQAELIGTAAGRIARVPRIIISCRALYPWRRPDGLLYLGLESVVNLMAHELIANSRAVLLDAERTERFVPETRTVIYNGIDVGAYRQARVRTDGPLRLVTVGALDPRKGQEYAVRALRKVRAAGVDAELTLVGAGADERMLKKVALELEVSDYVTFAGLQVDPRPYLETADLFVLPSRQEGFSNALLEAMASGLPVVATDVGGNSEAVTDRIGGRIVPPMDAAALAGAIIELSSLRASLPGMGQANRRRAEEQFSLTASAERLARWYGRGG